MSWAYSTKGRFSFVLFPGETAWWTNEDGARESVSNYEGQIPHHILVGGENVHVKITNDPDGRDPLND